MFLLLLLQIVVLSFPVRFYSSSHKYLFVVQYAIKTESIAREKDFVWKKNNVDQVNKLDKIGNRSFLSIEKDDRDFKLSWRKFFVCMMNLSCAASHIVKIG